MRNLIKSLLIALSTTVLFLKGEKTSLLLIFGTVFIISWIDMFLIDLLFNRFEESKKNATT